MAAQQRVVCAAIRKADNGLLILGVRHFDEAMFSTINELNQRMEWRGAEQGFMDNKWNFLTREDAWKIAEAAGQILFCIDWQIGSLHSEHLY